MSKSKGPMISAGVEHTTRAFLEALNAGGGPPMETMTPKDARAVLTGAQKAANATLPKADVSERTISVDGREVTLYIVRPAGVTKTLPAFIFIHGGGWVIGDFPTHERLVRDLVEMSGAVAVFVEYSRSPEAKYPVALNQAYAAAKWVAEHGREINVDGSRLAVVGNSVGGNMTGAVALLAKEKGGPALRLAVMFWPVTNASFDTGSYTQFAEGHFLSRNMMKWFWDCYAPDAAQRKDIHASLLGATTAQLKGLPPTLIQVAEFDVLHDEGAAYGRKLDEAGVEVTTTQYNGLIHDYGMLDALSQVPAVRSALLQAAAELKKRLFA